MTGTVSSAPPPPKAFNIKQASAYIGLSRSSIYKLFDAGKLQRIKVGKRVLIAREQLDLLLSTSTIEEGESARPQR